MSPPSGIRRVWRLFWLSPADGLLLTSNKKQPGGCHIAFCQPQGSPQGKELSDPKCSGVGVEKAKLELVPKVFLHTEKADSFWKLL